MRQHESIYDIQAVDPREFPEWDQLVGRCRGATFFHSQAWANVLCEAYPYKPIYLVRFERGAFVSALPLIEVNSWVTGKRGISLPFTDDCGVVTVKTGVEATKEVEELVEAALSLGAERGWAYTEIRDANHACPNLPPSASFYSHIVNLQGSKEDLFARFEGSVRRAVRKADREGLSVAISTEGGDMVQFYELHCRTRRRHGVPPQPLGFFEAISRNILAKKGGFVCLVKAGSRVIAAAVFFHFQNHAIYKFGASDFCYQGSRANNMVFWKAIEYLKELGCTVLDLGRTSLSNSGLRRFKRGWGSTERMLRYLRVDNRTRDALFCGDHSEGRLNAVFRRLPVCLNKAVGQLVYSHIA